MIRNQVLLKRMCQLVSQTFAVQIDTIFEESKQIGIEAVIEKLETETKITY